MTPTARPVAVVTGGGTGMGRAVAADLAADHDVVIVGRREAKLKEAATSIGDHVTVFSGDMSNVDYVQALIEHIMSTLARVDVVVNVAGEAPPPIRTTSDLREALAVWNNQFALNATTQFLLSYATARYLPRGGRIVNVSSEAAVTGAVIPGLSTYAASKAAVHGLTLALARELSPQGITVNCVAPGYVEQTGLSGGFTEQQRASQIARNVVGTAGTVADIAHAVRYLVSPRAGFVTGQFLHVNGGSTFGR